MKRIVREWIERETEEDVDARPLLARFIEWLKASTHGLRSDSATLVSEFMKTESEPSDSKEDQCSPPRGATLTKRGRS